MHILTALALALIAPERRPAVRPIVNDRARVGRNKPCPCGAKEIRGHHTAEALTQFCVQKGCKTNQEILAMVKTLAVPVKFKNCCLPRTPGMTPAEVQRHDYNHSSE